MGFYLTLGLVAAVAALALVVVRFFSRRASRSAEFPAEAWDSYLEKQEATQAAAAEGAAELERISGPEFEEEGEPEPEEPVVPPASDGSIPARLRGLEEGPRGAAAPEGRLEAVGPAPEDVGSPPPERGGPVEGQVELISGPPPAAASAEGPAPPPGPGGGRPWWEGLPAPREVGYRRTVAQLMGVAIEERPAPGAAAEEAPSFVPWQEAKEAAEEEGPGEGVSVFAGEEPREPAAAGPDEETGASEWLAQISEEPGPSAEDAGPAGEGAPGVMPEPPPIAGAEEAEGEEFEEAPVFEDEEADLAEPPAEAPPAPAPEEPERPPEEGEAEELVLPAEEEAREEPPDGALAAGEGVEPEEEAPVFLEEESPVPGGPAPAPAGAPPEREGPEAPWGEQAALFAEEEPMEEEPAAVVPAEPAAEELPEAELELEELAEEELALEAEEGPAVLDEEAPEEEDAGEDVFAVLRRERGDGEEKLPEEPLGHAALYEAFEGLENISEEEGVASGEAPGAPAAAEVREEPPPAAPEPPAEVPPSEAEGAPEAPAWDWDEPLAAEAAPEETAPPPSPPGDIVRKLAAELCPGDLLLVEEQEAELPAWVGGVVEAVNTDLKERQAGRRPPEAEEFLRVGILEYLLGRYDGAVGHLKEALRWTSHLGPVLNALAVATFAARGKVDPAVSYCREAFREAGADAAIRGAVCRNLGFFYQVKGDLSRAAEAVVAAIDCIGPGGDARQLSRLHMRAGQLFRRLGEAAKAREHLSEAAHLFRGTDAEADRARALVALASAQTETEEFDLALKNLEEAARLCQELGDKAGEALVFGQMGVTYTAQDQYTRALSYYENALRLHRERGNRKGEAANLSNIGNIHYFRGDLEEAQGAYEAALEINREQGHLIGQATSLGNLGRLHFEQGEPDQARARLEEARDLFKKTGALDQVESVSAMLEELDRQGGG